MNLKNKAIFGRISADFFLSILASAVTTIATTFIVNPILAKRIDSKGYGLLLTVAALVTMLSAVFGNTLNNTRLVQNDKKDLDDNNHTFNYKVIILISSIIATNIILIFVLFVYKIPVITSLLLGVWALYDFLNYYMVVFRVKINTLRNFVSSLLQAIVYIVAVLLVRNVLFWPIIYVLGEIVQLVYITLRTELPREKFKIDNNLKPILKTYIVIMLASIVGQIILYLDRFLIYPILGGEAVTIYTVSTVYSKLLVMVFAPIAFVLLSYYSQPNLKMTRKIYWLINLAVLVVSFLFLLTVPIFARYY